MVSDPGALWSECYDKAICLKMQSQRRSKAFPSFVPSTRLMGIGVWYAGVCMCVSTLGGGVGRLLLSWCSDSSILEYLGVHGLLLGYFPSLSF